MARPREIRATGKDKDGDIASLKGAFGEVTRRQAIREIESGAARYAVGGAEVRVVNGATGKYLRTAPDRRSKNNLDNLPDA